MAWQFASSQHVLGCEAVVSLLVIIAHPLRSSRGQDRHLESSMCILFPQPTLLTSAFSTCSWGRGEGTFTGVNRPPSFDLSGGRWSRSLYYLV